MIRSLWSRWLLASTAAQLLGFTLAGTVVFAASLVLVDARVLLVVPVVGAMHGALLGLAQVWALRASLPAVPRWGWVALTSVGAGLAWLMAAMLTDAVTEGVVARAFAPTLMALVVLAVGAGLGALQAVELGQHVRGASWWVAGNAGAWGLGLLPVLLALGLVAESPSVPAVALAWAASGLATGLVVGLVTGALLTWLVEGGAGARLRRRVAARAATK